MTRKPCRFCKRIREFLINCRKSRLVTWSVSRRNRGSAFVEAIIVLAIIVVVLAGLIWFGVQLNA